jgi:hypothetical protein
MERIQIKLIDNIPYISSNLPSMPSNPIKAIARVLCIDKRADQQRN